MCSIKYLHKEFKLRYNAIDSNHKKDFPTAFIDDFFNSALFSYVEMFSTGNNIKKYKMGFEVTQQRVDMLSTLVVPSEKLIPNDFNEELNRYEFKLNDLSEDYFHLIRAYTINECGLINIKPEQHDDLNIILNDYYKKPSKKWKRLISTIKRSSDQDGSSIYVYTNGEFNLDGIYIEYIKCPRNVFFGGYNTIDCDNGGYCSTDNPVDPDIPSKYCNLLVDMAVQEAASTLYDINQINIKENKINSII